MLTSWGISRKPFLLVYFSTFVAFISSKGLALFPGYAIDDWYLASQHLDLGFFIQRGRFTQAAFEFLFESIDVTSVSTSFPALAVTFVIAPLGIALALFYASGNQSPGWGLALAGAIIGAHPYLAEYFTFRQSSFGLALTFVFILGSFILLLQLSVEASLRNKALEISGLFIVLVLLAGTQQTSLLVVGMLVFARFIISAISNIGKTDWKSSWQRNRISILTVVASGLVYLAVHSAITKLQLSVSDPRTEFISPSEILPRISEIAALLKILVIADEPVLPSSVKIIGICLVLSLAITASIRHPYPALTVLAYGALSIALSIFLVSISGVWWPAPRTLFGISFALGITVALLSRWVTPVSRYFVIPLGVLFISTLTFESSTVLSDQLRSNKWDMWVAGTIASQVTTEGFSRDDEIILVNASWGSPVEIFTTQNDLNISALSVDYASKYVFAETTGRSWNISSISDPSLCVSKPSWPDRGSIFSQNSKVYVCMNQ